MDFENQARILVAEDDQVFAEILRFQLSRQGFEVVVVHDGESGHRLSQSEHFDLIITDYQMPKRNGEFVCLGARSTEINSATPIFMCTAKGYEVDTHRLREEFRIAEFFLKPFSPTELITKVNNALEVDTPAE